MKGDVRAAGKLAALHKNMILLSFSTLNELINEPHTWLCKQMELPRQTSIYMTEGKAAHRVIQDHVSGKKLDDRLASIKVTFPIVEEKDRDERTHFTIPVASEYDVHGYLDGIDPKNKRMLEIKTSATPWSMGKFYSLMQWRIYALAYPKIKEAWLITCTRDLQRPAVFNLQITEKHRQEAIAWINKGIDIIEAGDFSYKGVGRSRYCNYIGCPYCGGVRA